MGKESFQEQNGNLTSDMEKKIVMEFFTLLVASFAYVILNLSALLVSENRRQKN